MKTTPATKPAFAPVEVAYRVPGAAWKRATPKSAATLDRLLARLADEGAEVQYRAADGGT